MYQLKSWPENYPCESFYGVVIWLKPFMFWIVNLTYERFSQRGIKNVLEGITLALAWMYVLVKVGTEVESLCWPRGTQKYTVCVME